MALVFAVIIFASTAHYRPGLAQSNVPTSATAFANANAFSSGGRASANAYSYAYVYPSTNGGVRECTYNRCTPTCSLPVPQHCPPNSNPCNCPPGTIISQEGGQCVPEQQCPMYANCKGDYNATYTDCPNACPPTCAKPDNSDCYTKKCGAPGCECYSGYLLSSINGKCIKPEDCPGKVCGKNQVFVTCLIECPSLYCPVAPGGVACGISRPCGSGCTCEYKYLRKSVNNHTCILAEECPPGKCYGQNEKWNRCVSHCFSDSCKDRNKVSILGDCPLRGCVPRCLCKQGFYRNERRICVPAQECPPIK